MKKSAICCDILIAALAVIGIYQLLTPNNIGIIHGAEYEYLTINGQDYKLDPFFPVNGTDKEHYIGKIKSGDKTFKVYTIKGTEDYLYCRWKWEGDIYKIIK